MDDPVTVSYYVCVKGMTQDMIKQLREELDQLLQIYEERDHEVTITQVYY